MEAHYAGNLFKGQKVKITGSQSVNALLLLLAMYAYICGGRILEQPRSTAMLFQRGGSCTLSPIDSSQVGEITIFLKLACWTTDDKLPEREQIPTSWLPDRPTKINVRRQTEGSNKFTQKQVKRISYTQLTDVRPWFDSHCDSSIAFEMAPGQNWSTITESI